MRRARSGPPQTRGLYLRPHPTGDEDRLSTGQARGLTVLAEGLLKSAGYKVTYQKPDDQSAAYEVMKLVAAVLDNAGYKITR